MPSTTLPYTVDPFLVDADVVAFAMADADSRAFLHGSCDVPEAVALTLSYLVSLMVDDGFTVTRDPDGRGGTVLRLGVAPTDIGKVIGKQGRTARSLRILLAAISQKNAHRFSLDLASFPAEQPAPPGDAATPLPEVRATP